MRLHTITLEGFRGFVRKTTISLDADVVICHGPNGSGKTSLLDGILWALSGRLDRFTNGSPVSLYAKEGIARVELALRAEDRLISITRVTDGKNPLVKLVDGQTVLEGAQAEGHLISLMLPHLAERANATGAVARILTRGVYLQQDLIRQFIETDTPAERFSLISEIIGAGVVIDLQNELERSRAAWSRSTTAARKEQLQPLQDQLTRVQETIGRLETSQQLPTADIKGEADTIFNAALELLGTGRLTAQASPTSASELDRLLKDLAAQRITFEREISIASAVLSELQDGQVRPLDQMRQELAAAENKEAEAASLLQSLEQQVAAEIRRLQEERQKQIQSADHAKRVAMMAQIALDELGQVCPVCTQPYDKHVTETHLRALIEQVERLSGAQSDDRRLTELQTQQVEASKNVNELRARVMDLRRPLLELETKETLLRTRLSDLGIDDVSTAREVLNERVERLSRQVQQITDLLARGERLTLVVVRLGEERQKSELIKQRNDLEQRIAVLRADLDAQDKTHMLAGKIIEGLRRASLEITAKQVESLGPLLQLIYSRIDPHPTFKVTQIATDLKQGKGLLRAGISDPELDQTMHEVGALLSSSQLNSFAVSLFLALNLGIQSLRLNLSILDDPLQSLDAINLLGLVDVLRRLRERRQVLVSTHDDQLFGLLQRKLRPVAEGERLIILKFERWTKNGPEFRDLQFDYDVAANPRVLLAA
ncbi:MAG TPA: AAA family ATPase [Sphingomicrobium sp.]|nr:AAA family ATPase [Sphingomicrobium sp.]